MNDACQENEKVNKKKKKKQENFSTDLYFFSVFFFHRKLRKILQYLHVIFTLVRNKRKIRFDIRKTKLSHLWRVNTHDWIFIKFLIFLFESKRKTIEKETETFHFVSLLFSFVSREICCYSFTWNVKNKNTLMKR